MSPPLQIVTMSSWIENTFINSTSEYDFNKLEMTQADVLQYRKTLEETGFDSEKIDAYLLGDVTRNDVLDESVKKLNALDPSV